MQSYFDEKKYGYCLCIYKKTNEVIGQMGLLDEVINGVHNSGLGYIVKRINGIMDMPQMSAKS